MEKNNNVVKTISVMMVITLLGKVLGLVREQFMAYFFGGDNVALAFKVASTLPRNFLDVIFASAISASFIPIFNSYLEKKSQKEAYKLANNFITIVFLLSVAVTIILSLFSLPIVEFMLGNKFDKETIILCNNLFRVMLPLIILSVLAFSFIGILQSLGEFNIPASMSIVSNSVILFYYIFLMDKFGVYGLAVAFVIGWGTQLLIQIPVLIKNKYVYTPVFNLKDPGLKEIITLMMPVMVSTWVQPINVMVNIKISNSVNENWGAALDYANILYTIIAGVFVLSIANVVFTRISKYSANNNYKQFGETICTTLRSLFYFLIPMMVGLIVISKPLVKLLYERGMFKSVTSELTSHALVFYSLGIIGYGVQTILSRGFYADKNGKTPMVTGVIAIIINALLSSILVNFVGVGGPALASSISINVVSIIMLSLMYRTNKYIVNIGMVKDFILMLGSALVMGIIVLYSQRFIQGLLDDGIIQQVISIVIPVLIGIFVYLGLTRMFRINEANMAFNMLKRK